MNFFLYLLKNPNEIPKTVLALLRGLFYIVYYRIFAHSVKIGFPFLAYAKVNISGPGRVEIGGGCDVFKNVFKGLAIVTLSKDSIVEIGKKCSLGGLTIRCRTKVTLGDRVMTAVSLVQDSFFIYEESITEGRSVPESKPASIGPNVWLGGECIILGGSSIGEDSVVAAGALCIDASMKDYSLVSGNPARKALPIERLLRFKVA